MEVEKDTKVDNIDIKEDKKLTERLLDELFENINKLPSSSTIKSMKDFHLKSLEIIAKLEIIENKYKGKSNEIKRND